ncbi:hypothetical protein Q5752_004613 [Cryptotrichosporon argae]
MTTFTLSDGKKIPAIAFGNGTAGLSNSGDNAVQVGKAVLEAGILHIDTAQNYGTERETGAAIKAAGLSKDQVWVTTKIGKPGIASEGTTYENLKKSVDESIEKLGFKPDLLLIHNPFVPQPGTLKRFWSILEDLVEDGTLGGVSLGVSNFRPQDFDAILPNARIKPVVNQLEYHPYVLAHLDPILAVHEKHGIITESYGPLTPILRHPTGGPLKPVLERIGARLSKEAGQDVGAGDVLLLWTVAKGVVAVTSTSKVENASKLGRFNTLPKLTKDEVDEIEQVGRKIHFRHYKEHVTKDYPSPDLPEDL